MNFIHEWFKAKAQFDDEGRAERILEYLKSEGLAIEQIKVKGGYVELMLTGNDVYVVVALPKR